MKKIIKCMILGFYLSMLMGTVVSAETITFDIRVNRNITNVDPLSRRAYKTDDGDDCFYVTPTYFSCTGNIKVRSVNYSSPSIRSPYKTISSGSVDVWDYYYYNCYAPGGCDYYLEADYGSASTDSMRMMGRYTP